jgi:hypothetical protein
MSGQPYKKPQDITKFRAKYIESLNMRQELDKITCDAVRNYNATGQLPASSQMKDSRTTADILADTQRVKSNICSQLAEVSNMQFAQEVVQGVMNSPINIDNNLFVFMAQRINSIVEELKKIYSYKIKGDSDDVRSLVTFIERMYTDKNRLMASTKSFMDSLGISDFSESGGRLQAAKNALNKLLVVVSELNRQLKTKNEQNLLNQMYQKIKYHLDMIPDTSQQVQDLQNFVSDFVLNYDKGNVRGSSYFKGSDREELANGARSYLHYIYNGIPDVGTVQSLITQYNKLMKKERLTKADVRDVITKITDVLDREDVENRNYVLNVHEFLENWTDKLKKISQNEANKRRNEAIKRRNKLIKRRNPKRYYGDDDDEDYDDYDDDDDMPELDEGIDNFRDVPSRTPSPSNTGSEFIDCLDAVLNFFDIYGQDKNETEDYNPYSGFELNNDDDNKPVEESIKQTLDAVQDSTLDTGLNRSDQLIQGGLEEAQREVQQEQEQEQEQEQQYQQAEIVEPTPETVKKVNPVKPITPPDKYIATAEIDEEHWDKYQRLAIEHGEKEVKKLFSRYINYWNKEKPPGSNWDDKYAYVLAQIEFFFKKKVTKEAQQAQEDTTAPKPRSSGNGVGTRKTFKDCVMSSKTNDGIEPVPRYYKFGRWLVNLHKLNGEGIFVVRRPSGSGIAEFPSIKVSEKLGNVFKKMIKGGSLTYSDINGLTEAEKIYLHKVSSKAQIVDKFDIPAPPKEEVDKEIHTFEVMKGEILAGNDNTELIKKFKLLLVKLMRTSKINRKQGYEILEELAELGY